MDESWMGAQCGITHYLAFYIVPMQSQDFYVTLQNEYAAVSEIKQSISLSDFFPTSHLATYLYLRTYVLTYVRTYLPSYLPPFLPFKNNRFGGS